MVCGALHIPFWTYHTPQTQPVPNSVQILMFQRGKPEGVARGIMVLNGGFDPYENVPNNVEKIFIMDWILFDRYRRRYPHGRVYRTLREFIAGEKRSGRRV
ncbi:hypothetical protein ABW19_dt0202414 [Dactylella cylindrospora]|nr:hypothetical protein ABW19_dt0202414 [Dactylella cylindrospora]